MGTNFCREEKKLKFMTAIHTASLSTSKMSAAEKKDDGKGKGRLHVKDSPACTCSGEQPRSTQPFSYDTGLLRIGHGI